MGKLISATVLLFALCLAFGSVPAHAEVTYTYAVKFVCGKSDSKKIVMPGFYGTAINVHNPERVRIKIIKWFSEALPEQKAGKVSSRFDAGLDEYQAFEIDCPEIMNILDAKMFVKGFVTIQSNVKLNVTAVYTAAGKEGYVTSIDVEDIEPRVIQSSSGPCPDLIIYKHTNPVEDFSSNTYMMKVTVKNIGNARANIVTETAAESMNPSATSRYIGSVPTDPLDPGEIKTVSITLRMLNPGSYYPLEDYPVFLKVDAKGVLSECDESNNDVTFTPM